MKEKQKTQTNYILWLVILPVVVVGVVLLAVALIAYFFDKDEYQPDDTRGDDVLEMGMLTEPYKKWLVQHDLESCASESILGVEQSV